MCDSGEPFLTRILALSNRKTGRPWSRPESEGILPENMDASLAERLRARDQQALAELYDRYGRLAYVLIFRIVRNQTVAEDLVQEPFSRYGAAIQSFDDARGSLGRWILAVARIGPSIMCAPGKAA